MLFSKYLNIYLYIYIITYIDNKYISLGSVLVNVPGPRISGATGGLVRFVHAAAATRWIIDMKI